MLTRLKKMNSPWFLAILGGIIGTGLIASTLLCLRFLLTAPAATPEPITTENIESHLRDWVDALGLSIKKDTPDASTNVYFEYTVTLHDGIPIDVIRPKDRSHYLALQTAITVSPEHKAVMATWSVDESTRLADELLLELARGKVAYQIVGMPFDSIRIMKSLPISSDLSEDTFAKYLDDIDSQFTLAREEVRLLVAHNTHIRPR